MLQLQQIVGNYVAQSNVKYTYRIIYIYIYIYTIYVCVYIEGNSACIQIVSSLFRSRKNLYTGVTLCGTGTLVQPLPLPPLRQPAGQCVLNYNYLCMTKGHETCLMTHLPQSRTKRAAADAKIHRVRQEQHSRGKGQRQRGSYHALPTKPQRQSRAGWY